MGGTALQGACSNFRGKLCVWAHLLKVSPENSEEVVDKFVPKGSGRVVIDKIMSNIDGHVDANVTAVTSSWDSHVDSSGRLESVTGKATSPSRQGPKRSGSKPRSASRSGSSGRGRQGAWREARGPDEKEVGFRGKRNLGKNGFARWKKIVGREHKVADQIDAKLGAMPAVVPAAPTVSVPSASNTANLKAILGVSPSMPAPVASSNIADANATAGLKAILGVGGQSSHDETHLTNLQTGSNAPTSAADKLMQLMAAKHPVPHPSTPSMQMGPPLPSGFNFTYVEEGNEPATSTPMPGPVRPMMYQGQSVTGAAGYASLPPTSMQALDDEFPSLGSTTQGSKQRPETVTTKKVGSMQNEVMVPSVVATRTKRVSSS